MKIIDLLNKIANGEEVPKEIKVNDNIYHYDETDCNEFYRYTTMTNELLIMLTDLNDEVEIIEEEKKLPEKIDVKGSYNSNKGYEDFNDNEKILVDKINDLLDYLKSKGE